MTTKKNKHMSKFTNWMPQPGETIEVVFDDVKRVGIFNVGGEILMLGLMTSDSFYPITQFCEWGYPI